MGLLSAAALGKHHRPFPSSHTHCCGLGLGRGKGLDLCLHPPALRPPQSQLQVPRSMGGCQEVPMFRAPHLMPAPPPDPGPERLRTDPSRPLPGMLCQVSGECGGRLPSSGQGRPQCTEESTAAETPVVPAALTPRAGYTALMARLTGPRLPGPDCTPRSCSVPAFQRHFELGVSLCLEPVARLLEHSGDLSFPSWGSDHELSSGFPWELGLRGGG